MNITFCIPITFNYPVNACILNKKYPITVQTRTTLIVDGVFRIETSCCNQIFIDYWCTVSITPQI